MITLSLCMIVKNEAQTLARCLESVKHLPDEIIIVDTGSTDQTVEIAKEYTEKIYNFSWIDDFSAARNFAFSKASASHIIWLDADDIILPKDFEELLRLKSTLEPSVGTVMLRYHAAFDEEGNPTFTYYRERIVRNCKHAKWRGAVHEVITPFGNIYHSEAAICHKKTNPGDSARNLKIYQNLLKSGKTLCPREQFYYSRELYYNGFHHEAANELEAFLDGGEGWIENNIEACRFLALCKYASGDEQAALRALFRSLEYAAPRAEICCDIGAHFLAREDFHTAAHWYERALACPPEEKSGAFVMPDCRGFIPCLQLCVCYFRLGELEKSKDMNARAGKIKPRDPSYLQNVDFFAGLV